MNKLQVISVRIDPDTLAKIDEFAHEHYYWKRNTVINGVLEAVFRYFDKKALFDMVHAGRYGKLEIEATFKVKDPNG